MLDEVGLKQHIFADPKYDFPLDFFLASSVRSWA